MAKKTAPIVSVGEGVRLPLNEVNDYVPSHAIPTGSEAVTAEGLICAIRHIARGEYVATAAGNLRQYVVEILINQSFHPAYASPSNVGEHSTRRIQDNPVWRAVRDRLVALRNQGELPAGGLAVLSGPLKDLVDNWRIVKIRARALQPLERPLFETVTKR